MRLYNIDFLRGLAVLMVLLVHASSSTIPWIEESPIHKVFEIGKYGVEIFFVISGYIICHSLFLSKYSFKNLFQFLAKRLIRINPPVYIVMLAYLLIELFTYLLTGHYLILSDPFEFKRIVGNFLFLSGPFETDFYIGTFWTLEIELQFYFLIAFTFPLLTNKSNAIRFIVFGGILMLGFSNIPLALSGYIACFLLGVAYFLFQNGFMDKIVYSLSFVLITVIFLNNGQYFELLFSIFSLLMITIKKPVKSNLFQYFGKISYSLYIVHIFVFTYLDVLLNRFNLNHLHNTIPTKVVIIIVYSGIAILISHLFYRYIEKSFVSYSKKISWK